MPLVACPACAALVSPTAGVCPRCGHEIRPSAETLRRRRIAGTGILVLVLIGIVVAMIWAGAPA